ncbi:MAG: GTPase HflX [bacterium]
MAGLRLPGTSRDDAEESLDELAALVRASGARVAGRALQSRARVDGRTYLGKGKAAELKEDAARLGANLIVLDHDLSPAQGRNLEEILELKVLDRTELILDIFARRAHTPVAKLQVEVAQLEYLLPRLTRLWEHLSRTGGGIGTRGPGETQLEVDRRRIRDRLTRLKQRLTRTGRQLEVQRNLHGDVFRVALVGYTNTGKSTLMHALTSADVDRRDRLFETLDATTRILDLGAGYRATLTDTVGFVQRLPHTLVESFRATLAEVVSADLLLHVHDISSRHRDMQSASVEAVLKEIGAAEIPQISIWNKCDRLEATVLEGFRRRADAEAAAVLVSALDGDGIDDLRAAIRARLRRGWLEVEGVVPLAEGEILARLRAAGEVLEETTLRTGRRVRVRLAPAEWQRLSARFGKRAPGLFRGDPPAESAEDGTRANGDSREER